LVVQKNQILVHQPKTFDWSKYTEKPAGDADSDDAKGMDFVKMWGGKPSDSGDGKNFDWKKYVDKTSDVDSPKSKVFDWTKMLGGDMDFSKMFGGEMDWSKMDWSKMDWSKMSGGDSKTGGMDWMKIMSESGFDWNRERFAADFGINFDGQAKIGTPDLTCMKGTIMKDMKTQEVIYDDVHVKKCNEQWATECSKQTMKISYVDETLVETTTGLCWNSQFNNIFQAFEGEQHNWMDTDATIIDSTKEHCQGSNCFDISSDAEDTLQCYYGMTVTDDSTGEELFVNKEVVQCKIYEYCETNIIKQTVTKTSQQLIYKFTDCGDPFSMKYKGLNIVPYIPEKLDDVSRMRKCAEYNYGCTENYLGLCVCKNGLDVSRYATMSARVTETCTENLCNE